MRQKCHKKGAVSPCAACKLLRRKCVKDCIFAPYFPAKESYNFASVHKIFGASNVNKMLQVKIHFSPWFPFNLVLLILLLNLLPELNKYNLENKLINI